METVACLQNESISHGFFDAKESAKLQNLILMNQVHSADVLFIDAPCAEAPQVDALITKTPQLALAVKTADCAPVLLFEPKSKIVAAIHAGWKGAFQGVIENTILKMIEVGADVSYLMAGIGPHIQKESFEADEKMKALFPVTEHHFFEKVGEGRYHFDFHGYVVYRLKRAGVKFIDSVLIDTYQNNQYLSYRRDPSNPARQFSVIMLK
ncbi:MAG: peptidoglycan editing factor PgeF [Alphaproteobacteria bacterium]|nr:peptidoglycan editing factor PgeF [Alphaproteobacteria bacterium]